MGAHAYAVTNLLSGLAGTAYTWSAGSPSAADRALVNDGRMDKRLSVSGLGASGTVVVDFGSATTLTGWAFLNHNLQTQFGDVDVTIKIEAADDAAITVNAVTAKAETTLARYLSANSREPMNKDHVLQFASTSKRYWRITFARAGGMITLAIGEMFAFNAQTSLTRKGIYGSGDGAKLYTSELEFDSGETRGVFFGGPVRRKVLRWQDFDDDERDELRTLFYATQGNASKLLFINSYEATGTAAAAAEQDCIYGRLEGLDDLPYNEMDFGLFQLPDFQIRSLGREVGA